MNNARRRIYRRVISIGVGIILFFAVIAYFGVEFSFFNHYNPLYNPFILMTFAFLVYWSRSRLKDKKETTTAVAFTDTSGLSDMFDIDPTEEDSTHIRFTDEAGNEHSIKHGPPLLFPTEDGYERIYLVPRKGRVAISPAFLVNRYARKLSDKAMLTIKRILEQIEPLKLTKEQIAILQKIPEIEKAKLSQLEVDSLEAIPEMEAIQPEIMNKEMTEVDEPDSLFEEFVHHMAMIRNAIQDLANARPPLFQLLMYASSGALAMLILLILGHADFSKVGG